MPLYEYQCEKCGGLFEVIQKFADAPIAKHENCGGVVRRLLSAPALQFKGSGWYVNDYAKGSGSGAPSNGSSGKSDASASSSGDSGSGKDDKSGSNSVPGSSSSSSDSGSSSATGAKADKKSS